MTRLLVLAVLFVAPLAAPAAPVPKGIKRPTGPDLSNTHWELARDGNKGIPSKYHFQDGGVLVHTKRGRHGRGRGTWEQRGDTVTLYPEGGLTTYTLTYTDGALVGAAKSEIGFVWEKKLIKATGK